MSDITEKDDGPAELLVGETLSGKWEVERRLRRDYDATGETRSCGYKAISNDGKKEDAFVKAFDFHKAEFEGDTDALERMVREYNYERDVHKLTTDKKLTRVTRFIDAGKITVDGQIVHYIICEWADKCLRESYVPGDREIPLDELLTILRKVASGIEQLHNAGIAHQDIKPSNAVCFSNGTDPKIKLIDLGSSSCKDIAAPPHDQDSCVGQINYAPYESLYDQAPSGWNLRRKGCDIFLLGNLLYTEIVGWPISIMALHYLPEHLRHTTFDGDFRQVIPYLIDAHVDLVSVFEDYVTDIGIRGELQSLVLELCHPDPLKRGFKRQGLKLNRVVSKLDLLSKKTKYVNNVQ